MSIRTVWASAVNIFQAGPTLRFSALPTSSCSEYYVRTFLNWKKVFECCHVMTVPTLPILENYADLFLQDGCGSPTTWHIAITEYGIIALPPLLGTARNRAVNVAYITH